MHLARRELGDALVSAQGSTMTTADSPDLSFLRLDTDGDGYISHDELRHGLSDFGLTESEIEGLFFALDADHDGKVLSAAARIA